MSRIEVRSVGADKVNAIKVIREVSGLGLKEAKDFVESLDIYGSLILELLSGITPNDAVRLLQAIGVDANSLDGFY